MRAAFIAPALLACACATTPQPRYFVLDAVAQAADRASGLGVRVESVAIPAEVDRPQFVLTTSANEVRIDDQHRWGAPLQGAIADVVAGDLAAQLGTQRVRTQQDGALAARYRVDLTILRFQSRLGEDVLIDAMWRVRRADGATASGRTVLRESAPEREFSALAGAHSRALAQLSAALAQAILGLEA